MILKRKCSFINYGQYQSIFIKLKVKDFYDANNAG